MPQVEHRCDRLLSLQVKQSERVVSTELGLLIRWAEPSDQGLYYCLSTENSFKRTVAKIRLQVLSEAVASALTEGRGPPGAALTEGRGPPLAALSPAERLAVRRFCQEREEVKRLQRRPPAPPPGPLRGDLAKLRPLLERRKSRHRRNQVPEV